MGVGPLAIGLPGTALPTPGVPAIEFGLTGAFAPGGVRTFASVAGEAAGGSRGGLPLPEATVSAEAGGAACVCTTTSSRCAASACESLGTQSRPLHNGQLTYVPAFLLGTARGFLQRGQGSFIAINH